MTDTKNSIQRFDLQRFCEVTAMGEYLSEFDESATMEEIVDALNSDDQEIIDKYNISVTEGFEDEDYSAIANNIDNFYDLLNGSIYYAHQKLNEQADLEKKSFISDVRDLCGAIDVGDSQTISDRMLNVQNKLPLLDKSEILTRLNLVAIDHGVSPINAQESAEIMLKGLVESHIKHSEKPDVMKRWATEDEAVAFLGSIPLKSCEIIFNNLADCYIKAVDADSLYAVVEIDDLTTSAFKDVGNKAEIAQILSSFSDQIVRDLESFQYSLRTTNELKNAIDCGDLNFSLSDTNNNVVGRFYVCDKAEIFKLKKEESKDKVVIGIDMGIAMLLKGTQLSPISANSFMSRTIASHFNDIGQSILKNKDFSLVDDSGVIVAWDNKSNDNENNNVFSKLKFVAIDGYFKPENAVLEGYICVIGDIGDPDDFNEAEMAIDESIFYSFESQEEFDKAVSSGGIDYEFVITSHEVVDFENIRRQIGSSVSNSVELT